MSDLISEVPASSPDFQSEAAQKLASLFPEVIADGKIDVTALQTLLGADAAGGGSVSAYFGQVRHRRSGLLRLQPRPHLHRTMKTQWTGIPHRMWSLKAITSKS